MLAHPEYVCMGPRPLVLGRRRLIGADFSGSAYVRTWPRTGGRFPPPMIPSAPLPRLAYIWDGERPTTCTDIATETDVQLNHRRVVGSVPQRRSAPPDPAPPPRSVITSSVPPTVEAKVCLRPNSREGNPRPTRNASSPPSRRGDLCSCTSTRTWPLASCGSWRTSSPGPCTCGMWAWRAPGTQRSGITPSSTTSQSSPRTPFPPAQRPHGATSQGDLDPTRQLHDGGHRSTATREGDRDPVVR